MANVLFYDNTIQHHLSSRSKKGATSSIQTQITGLITTNNQPKNFTYHKKQLEKLFPKLKQSPRF
jgi:hypothetical protein